MNKQIFSLIVSNERNVENIPFEVTKKKENSTLRKILLDSEKLLIESETQVLIKSCGCNVADRGNAETRIRCDKLRVEFHEVTM